LDPSSAAARLLEGPEGDWSGFPRRARREARPQGGSNCDRSGPGRLVLQASAGGRAASSPGKAGRARTLSLDFRPAKP